ncbi:MAG TPA: inner membrane CreD family protein, partial [Azonexus sp.]|nr:inner membrane CreD family protein [Azonexus sp.]
MDKKVLYKILAIGLMSILLLVPLSLIEDQIRARSGRQNEVKQNIANSAAGAQMLNGPVIALRYREAVEPETVKDPETGRITRTPRYVEKTRFLPPEALSIDGEAAVETRHRGIYQARLFHLNLAVAGRFVIEPLIAGEAGGAISNVEATLLLGIADPRGVDSDPEVTINGQRQRFATPGGKAKAGADLALPQLAIALGSIDPTQPSTF